MNVRKTLFLLLSLVIPAFCQLPKNSFAVGQPPVGNTCNGVSSELCIPVTCVRPELIDPLLNAASTSYNPTQADFGADMGKAISAAGNGGCVDASGINPGGMLFTETPIFQGTGISSTSRVSIYWPSAHIYSSVIQMTGIRPGSDIGFPSGGVTSLGTTISLCNATTATGGTTGCGPNNYPLVSSPNYVTGGPNLGTPYNTGTISCLGISCVGVGTSWSTSNIAVSTPSGCDLTTGGCTASGSLITDSNGGAAFVEGVVAGMQTITLQTPWNGATGKAISGIVEAGTTVTVTSSLNPGVGTNNVVIQNSAATALEFGPSPSATPPSSDSRPLLAYLHVYLAVARPLFPSRMVLMQ
jgi:hypothetical protein